MPRFHVGAIDLAILIGYVVATRIFFGWWASRKAAGKGAEGYFLAGRRMTWPLIGLSFYVSNMSGSTFVGLPGSGYQDGIGVFHYEWLPKVILIFFVFFMLPLYLRAQVYTAPEYLELRYDRRSRLAFSGFLLAANILHRCRGRSLRRFNGAADPVFPTLAFDLLPTGLRGVILASLTAAILSSLESILNSAATLFTWDFYRTIRPRAKDQTLVRVGKLSTVGFMILSALWAPQIARFPTLWQYLQSILAYVTPPVGIFWRRANGKGAFWALAAGIPLVVAGWIVVEIVKLFRFPFLYGSGVMLMVGIALVVGGSLLTSPPPSKQVETLLWRPAVWRKDSAELAAVPWHRDPRVLSVTLLLMCAALLIMWW